MAKVQDLREKHPDGPITGHLIQCPACGCGHLFNNSLSSDAKRACWTFNGDYERPTFEPSMLVRYPRGYAPPEDFKKIPHLGTTEDHPHGQVLWSGDPDVAGSRTGVYIPLELIGNDTQCELTVAAVAAKMGVDATFDAIDARVKQWRCDKFPGYVCHSFVRNGKIEFLSDCSHHLAGKIVPLEDD